MFHIMMRILFFAVSHTNVGNEKKVQFSDMCNRQRIMERIDRRTDRRTTRSSSFRKHNHLISFNTSNISIRGDGKSHDPKLMISSAN